MSISSTYRCRRCGGEAAMVKAPGRGARKIACQNDGCRDESRPFTLSQMRRQQKSEAIAANRIKRATAAPHWTHEVYG